MWLIVIGLIARLEQWWQSKAGELLPSCSGSEQEDASHSQNDSRNEVKPTFVSVAKSLLQWWQGTEFLPRVPTSSFETNTLPSQEVVYDDRMQNLLQMRALAAATTGRNEALQASETVAPQASETVALQASGKVAAAELESKQNIAEAVLQAARLAEEKRVVEEVKAADEKRAAYEAAEAARLAEKKAKEKAAKAKRRAEREARQAEMEAMKRAEEEERRRAEDTKREAARDKLRKREQVKTEEAKKLQKVLAYEAEAKRMREQLGMKAELPEASMCVVCLENPKTHVFTACFHKCVCETCVPIVKQQKVWACPLCRIVSTDIRRVYD